MIAKEVSKALLSVWTVVEMNLQLNGMLTPALVATEVKFRMPACGVLYHDAAKLQGYNC